MTDCDEALSELRTKLDQVQAAEKAATAAGATEREISDAKMLRESFMALRRRSKALIAECGTPEDNKAFAELEAIFVV